jgi:hypothetical protein
LALSVAQQPIRGQLKTIAIESQTLGIPAFVLLKFILPVNLLLKSSLSRAMLPTLLNYGLFTAIANPSNKKIFCFSISMQCCLVTDLEL